MSTKKRAADAAAKKIGALEERLKESERLIAEQKANIERLNAATMRANQDAETARQSVKILRDQSDKRICEVAAERTVSFRKLDRRRDEMLLSWLSNVVESAEKIASEASLFCETSLAISAMALVRSAADLRAVVKLRAADRDRQARDGASS